MRVASVAFTDYDSDPRVRRMSEALAARGDTVVAIALREPGKPARRKVSGVDVLGVGNPRYQGTSTLRYITQYLNFTLTAMIILTKLHLRERFDVVHVNNMPDFLVFCAIPAKLLGARVILDLHDPMPELYVAKMGGSASHPIPRVLRVVERLSIAFSDRAISVQQVHIDTFVAHGNPRAKFTEVQNAPDTRLFPVGAARDHQPRPGVPSKLRIVYHGTMAPRLGIDVLLHAADKARYDLGDFEVVLIGDGDDGERLEGLIDTLDLMDIVRFDRGFIPVDALLKELVTADIGVVPAGLDAFTATMLPSKLLEYVTLGIPVVSADLPAVRRYFGADEMAYFPPGDAAALSDELRKLAHDPELRRSQADKAMRFLEDHSWEVERDRYLDLVDSLAS